MPPLFTIGMPVFNAMPYLPEAVESALRQTYPHFELLIINDGSQDESRQYLGSLRDARVRVISQENRGITATLNRLLEEARAPWLARLDADDVACPERLALVAEALEHHSGAGMFYSRAVHYGHAQAIAPARSTEGSPCALREITRAGYLLSIVHSSVVLNVGKTRALGGYRFDLHIEDLDLWWRMALRYDLVFIPWVTTQYRLNHGSVCIGKLRELSANTLFAQYLLLSHLWGLEPLHHQAVIGALNTMVDVRRLAYRERMWRAAAEMGAQRYSSAVPHLLAAAWHSPAAFVERVRSPFARNTPVRRGEDPQRFRRIFHQLWPATEVKCSAAALEPA